MIHRAYVNFWASDVSELSLLDRFGRLLGSVPLSASQPQFTRLVVRAIGPAESPLVESDLRGAQIGAAEVVAMAKEYVSSDTETEVATAWDLWQPGADGAWARTPAPLLLLCRGYDYDDGLAVQSGQFEADLGFESLFTGDEDSQTANPQHLSQNIRQLFDWIRAVETVLPAERYQLWSEGEENLEARLDDILSLH